MADATTTLIHRATLDLLEHVGVRVDSAAALELFATHAIRVDRERRRVYPEAHQIDTLLATAPRTFEVCGRDTRQPPLRVGGDTPYIIAGGASVRVLELDGRYTSATWEHLRQFNRLLDALPHIHLLLNQVDPVVETPHYHRRLAAEMLTGTGKPCALQAESGEDIEAMIGMGACIRGSRDALSARPLFLTGSNAEPPLCIPAKGVEILLAAAAGGIPCGIGDYCMAGSTAPATTAGAVTQRNAVQLVAVMLIQLARPGAPCYYSAATGCADMRTLDPVTASPHAARMTRLSVQQGRSYGLPVWSLAATDARQPDAQAAFERAAMLQLSLASGASLIQGPTSMMDQMMLSSFTQAIIDHDIIGYLLLLQGESPVNEETLAQEAIRDVVTDPAFADMKFAAHPHTAGQVRHDDWQPLTFACGGFAEWQRQGQPSLVDRARACAERLLATHQPTPLDPGLAARVFALAR
jgi:trimethylamine--corrinoid protein Co-methyltransferase